MNVSIYSPFAASSNHKATGALYDDCSLRVTPHFQPKTDHSRGRNSKRIRDGAHVFRILKIRRDIPTTVYDSLDNSRLP